MSQNLLELLSILVNENNYKNHKDILAMNVEAIFKYKDAIQILFEQLDSENMYTRLVIIDIIRSSLSVNSVCILYVESNSLSWVSALTRVR